MNAVEEKFPLVSVIVRTKDRPHLLREALESIAAQSYSHIEIIVVNDGGENVGSIVHSRAHAFQTCQYISLSRQQGRYMVSYMRSMRKVRLFLPMPTLSPWRRFFFPITSQYMPS
jgi:cellulose synthase/poly-beta-1,6-N-acetylglucosamine synthase-like glycosyltransferase